jgi:cell division control protein 6
MSDGNPLMWEESIFQQPEMFETDYLPDKLYHRESQLRGLAANIKPAERGSSPNNAYCRGPPATGKTSAVRMIFNQIQEQSSRVACVHINCQLNSTRFGVFSKIYQELTGQEPPSSGVPFQKLYDRTARVLKKEEKVLVVALDDINYLFNDREDSEVVYSLLRMHENYPGVKVGIISILSDLSVDLFARLDARAQSVFLAEEISFPEYNRSEITDILRRRMDNGFMTGAASEEILERAVDCTLESGDLRIGINTLKRAGESAEQRASRTISLEDVENAFKFSRIQQIRMALAPLTEDEKKLVRCIAGFAEKDGTTEIMAGTLYDEYRKIVNRGYTSYYEMINRLEDRGMLKTQKSGEGQRGQSRLISLTYEAGDVLSGLGLQKK